MKIVILGIDGYIGWPLALDLLEQGHEVAGVDNFSRRLRVFNEGSDSLTPISSIEERTTILHNYGNFKGLFKIKLEEAPSRLSGFLDDIKPEAIVHLAEMPSASWSMINAYTTKTTQYENVIGTLNLLWAMKECCPDAHLIKLGTMGEYGTPECDIPEGEITDRCLDMDEGDECVLCPMSGLPFPRSPGSFYHLSKVHDTHNIIFACKNWSLRSTDIMQGVVYGLIDTTPDKLTRFDYDEYFGTAINRFCTQALIEHPITVYGKGNQQRGFIPLKDSIQCLNIALNNPPKAGEYRTFNQFERTYSLNYLSMVVYDSARKFGLKPDVQNIPNPRNELEEHYYNPTYQKLFDLGYEPTDNIIEEVDHLIETLIPFTDRVKKEVIMPTTEWR
jgi:nucleoside-diphosphate-sugar epimerase